MCRVDQPRRRRGASASEPRLVCLARSSSGGRVTGRWVDQRLAIASRAPRSGHPISHETFGHAGECHFAVRRVLLLRAAEVKGCRCTRIYPKDSRGLYYLTRTRPSHPQHPPYASRVAHLRRPSDLHRMAWVTSPAREASRTEALGQHPCQWDTIWILRPKTLPSRGTAPGDYVELAKHLGRGPGRLYQAHRRAGPLTKSQPPPPPPTPWLRQCGGR